MESQETATEELSAVAVSRLVVPSSFDCTVLDTNGEPIEITPKSS
jgi:hypothetical protein